MRGQGPGLVLAVTVLLAGCSTPAEPAAQAPPRLLTPDPVVLVEGTFQWHETGTPGSPNALEHYELASQAVAHPCVWDGSGGEEVYFNNRRLPVDAASLALGPWSGNLSVTLGWGDDDWLGDALRIAYEAPGLPGLRQTPPIEKGSTATIPIRVPPQDTADGTANATEDAAVDGADAWSVWVCLPTDTGEAEAPFWGSVDARLVFTPDPVPEDAVAPDEAAPKGRTARTGGTTSAGPAPPAL